MIRLEPNRLAADIEGNGELHLRGYSDKMSSSEVSYQCSPQFLILDHMFFCKMSFE